MEKNTKASLIDFRHHILRDGIPSMYCGYLKTRCSYMILSYKNIFTMELMAKWEGVYQLVPHLLVDQSYRND